MWQPDGWAWRARIGVLTPHLDIGPESELVAMAPPGVSIHAARLPLPISSSAVAATFNPDVARAYAEAPGPDEAAALLAGAPLHAMIFAFTSSSYVHGPDGDRALKVRLERSTHGIPVVVPCLAAARALRTLGVRRLAMIDPPWFPPELSRLGAEYYRQQGYQVLLSGPAEFSGNPLDVHPGQLYDWARSKVPAEAAAVLIGGSGFRAIGVIQALEQDLQRPVLTANQVALWQALHLAGARVQVAGYGRLFDYQPTAD